MKPCSSASRKRVPEDNFVITTPAAVPSIFVDPLLLEQALINVIENALVHASGGKLYIGADYGETNVRMWVEDEGPGVPQSDLPRIFDKFHRVDGSRNTEGVGLGLAITKGFVEAMKGEVSATSPVRDGRGLRVEFVFPMQADLGDAMTPSRLLVVDDEPQIVSALKPGLQAAGYDVEAVGSASEALDAVAQRAFDVLIVDLGLPDMDGKELIARIREWADTPVIVLSARDAEDEKIAALDIGANDFVNKPFSIGELMARLRVVMRSRASAPAPSDAVRVGHLEIDFNTRGMIVAGKAVRASPREMKLLRALTQRPGAVLTHKQIVTAVWGAESVVEAQFVRVLIGNLRQKVEKDPTRPTLIITEPGIGYRLAEPLDESDAPAIGVTLALKNLRNNIGIIKFAAEDSSQDCYPEIHKRSFARNANGANGWVWGHEKARENFSGGDCRSRRYNTASVR